ncbi:MAG: glycine--tRNA ligase beta subunit [Porticoccaceae bacterium]|nr:MAG: glycine--tRNA ligase beta subunit [Porticoccaceae bacterium]
MKRDFLVEIGTEELPPKSLRHLSEAFAAGIARELEAAGLDHGELRSFATPRRLAVRVAEVAERSRDREVVHWGPPVRVAFAEGGKPTRAAEAFAQRFGLDLAELPKRVAHDGKQEKLCHRTVESGIPAPRLLPGVVSRALADLPIPRRMRWGSRREEFVRPVHWVVLLFGEEVVEAEILGIAAGRESRGHRFHAPGPIALTSPSEYEARLEEAKVLADFARRRERVRRGVEAAAAALGGLALCDDALLDEVTALTEWPLPLAGRFEERFLELPPEVLISVMQVHQRYFAVLDDAGKLLPHFVAVANIESRDPARVIAGNERVIRPRLSDAAFFYDNDRRERLEARRERLKGIIFQERLGTLYDKTERIAALAEVFAVPCGADPAVARRAGLLSKADLASEMVGEFPELQGVMGRYYARHDGEPEPVAEAIYEHYLPRFAGDAVPATAAGAAVGLADRIDSLVGIFAIGGEPTGSKDPFGLRRLSVGLLRILVERAVSLKLRPVLTQALAQYQDLKAPADTVDRVLAYVFERFRAWYAEEGVPAEVFQAVHAKNLDDPWDFHRRVLAVNAFLALPEVERLAAAHKRVANILSGQEEIPERVEAGRFAAPEEQVLHESLERAKERVAPLLVAGDYTEALRSLAELADPVDRFFDGVLVMAEDPALRANRLALLRELRDLFLQVADISHLARVR